MDVEELNTYLLVGSGILVVAVLAARVASRSGLPTLLLYLLIGIALGDAGLGVPFDDAELAHALGFGALVIILAEGGLTTRWSSVRTAMPIGLSLATIGVAVSTGLTAVVVHYLLDVPWTQAVLLGAILSPTDAAAVFSTLRRVPLHPRVSGALEAESGLNDAPTVLLVTLLSTGAYDELGPWGFVGVVLFELVAGALIGAVVARSAVGLLRRAALPSSGLYPLAVMGFVVLSYGIGSAVHASGFAAVYVAGLVLGNSDLPHRAATRSFVEGTAWLAQIGLFIMLGLLTSPGRITLTTVVLALIVGVILTLVIRPASVFAAYLPFGLGWREKVFVSAAGLRGAVPVVLATIPLAQGVPGSVLLFDVVFVTTFIFTLLQTPPLPLLARKLGVSDPTQATGLEIESAPLEGAGAGLLNVTVSTDSLLHGVEIAELRLPPGAEVSLVVRDGRSFVPTTGTRLRHGDALLVVVTDDVREAAEERLRTISTSGRLGKWAQRPEPGP